MRTIAVLLFFLIALQTQALATWSVIAVDRKTGEVVIASATCVPQQAFAGFPARGLKDVQAIIIPGVGVAAAQANVDRTRALQKRIADELKRGTDPARIIDMLKAEDPNHPDRVMAAMEAADSRGGDRRCNCNTKPDPPAPCDNKTAHVAYLVAANKSDKIGEGLNDGSYYLEIQVTDQDIKPDENDNPVKTLRTRYNRWVKDHAERRRPTSN